MVQNQCDIVHSPRIASNPTKPTCQNITENKAQPQYHRNNSEVNSLMLILENKTLRNNHDNRKVLMICRILTGQKLCYNPKILMWMYSEIMTVPSTPGLIRPV